MRTPSGVRCAAGLPPVNFGVRQHKMERPLRDNYEEFRVFGERGPADALRSWLELEGVPAVVESRLLVNAVETQYVVCVASRLAHRARWIAAQLRPSDAELEFLATGRLPGQKEE